MDHVHSRERTGRRRRALLGAALALASTVLGTVGVTASAASSTSPDVRSAAVTAPPSSGTLFDDFNYTGPDDPGLAAHNWTIRGETGGPGPIGAKWSPNAVSFPADSTAQGGRAMQLRASTDGTAAGTVQAQVSTAQRKFYSGTYAARVFFTDRPTAGDSDGRPVDHPVQTFYAITPENPLYSELDHEYLPNGGWGAPGSSHFTTAWHDTEPADKETYNKENAVTSLQGWHTLQMTAVNGAVDFYLDGRKYFSPSAKYAPREPMTLNFNEWFIDLVSPGQTRTWDQRVNWVYYDDSGAQTPAQVDAAVNGYYAGGIHFVDTVPTKSPANDHDGDGIGDLSLLYDYGKGSATGCAQNGSARRTALFSLSGKADRSGGLSGITPLSDSPCETASPKFVTSGDFNGDGKSDVAAFYDYGSAGSTCSPTNHVAIVEWLADPKGSGALQSPKTVWESTCWGGGTSFMKSGDFNGDGKSDLALLYDYGAGHVRLFTQTADGKGSGGFGGVVSQWDGSSWGTGTKFLTSGDFNGDGKSDIALFYDYGATGATCKGNAHQSVSTLTANSNGDGGFNGSADPTKVWESTCWGGGTAFFNSGDFNGDGKSDLALLYDYGAGNVSLLTLSANPNGSGGFGGLVPRWDGTRWGAGTKFMTTSDYNGDGKSDIALFKDYGASGATCAGNAHQAISTLTADPYGTGALHSPATAWESTCWGGGTAFMN
ncbi:FG-GAP-like repeat-containing protein [Streptomyces sp. WM6378]|uniref:FG-GAP-like repeat-containing protein n=1 Tax=Streptomyces sp. WM6378 TaxID=1415557 RepID=UPI0006AE6D8A|nr:FG-GAP-like repeat-containing protein [Streptomyces sp. WM6378]